MKNNDIKSINKALIVSITTVLLFIFAMFGITYAFFGVTVSGNAQASSIIVNVADLGVVNFQDGNLVGISTNILPMTPEQRLSKTFTITASDNTVDIDYTIHFLITENTFIENYENEFSYTLNGSSNSGGITTTNVNESVPTTAGDYIIGTGVLDAGGDIHTYTFTIGLNEVNSNQNYNQGKSFSGKLAVESKKYTHDRSVWGE